MEPDKIGMELSRTRSQVPISATPISAPTEAASQADCRLLSKHFTSTERPFMKVIIAGTDGSEGGERAVSAAADLAKAVDAGCCW
jgi:hypothetical protein